MWRKGVEMSRESAREGAAKNRREKEVRLSREPDTGEKDDAPDKY